jgi:hypothetical protein
VPAEDPGRAELAELVAHHVLGAEDVDERPAVVDLERVPDELGHDRARPRPRPDRRPAARRGLQLDLAEQLLVHERTFFQ